MGDQKGSTTKLLLGIESAFGQAPAAGYVMPFNSCDVVPSKTLTVPGTITGSRNPVQPFDGNKNVGGPLAVPADSLAMAYWLHCMFGAAVSTGGPAYVHEFKIGDTMPSFTLEKHFTDLAVAAYERLVGCKVASFAMNVGGDGELVANLQVVGADGTLEASAFDADPAAVAMARLKNSQAAIAEAGSALAYATELGINLSFGLDEDKYCIGGGGIRESLPEGIVGVTGNLKTIFRSQALLDKAVNGTETSLKLTITGSSTSVLEFEIQELIFDMNGVAIPGPQGLIVDLNFSGYFENGAEASAVVARLTNGVASYDL